MKNRQKCTGSVSSVVTLIERNFYFSTKVFQTKQTLAGLMKTYVFAKSEIQNKLDFELVETSLALC